MIMGILTVLWEKWVEFRHNFFKITSAAMIAPLMYILVFGFGVQTISHGQPYLNFLIPGVVALTSMNGSFNAIAQTLNVQRLYEKAFDQVMISPTPLWQFIAGQIIGGSLRGVYAGSIFLCKKPCRCTAILQLCDHADVLSVQYFFLCPEYARWNSTAGQLPSIITDKRSFTPDCES